MVAACCSTDVISELVEPPLLMRLTALLQQHRYVPLRDSDGTTTSYILALAERLLLTQSSRALPDDQLPKLNESRCEDC